MGGTQGSQPGDSDEEPKKVEEVRTTAEDEGEPNG